MDTTNNHISPKGGEGLQRIEFEDNEFPRRYVGKNTEKGGRVNRYLKTHSIFSFLIQIFACDYTEVNLCIYVTSMQTTIVYLVNLLFI